MSIHIVTGKPGGGKGLVTVDEVVRELQHGTRPIIGNLALRVAPWVRYSRKFGKTTGKPEIGLRAYLELLTGKSFDVDKRVHLLTDDQTREFYRYRVRDGQLIEAVAERDDKGRCTGYDTTDAMTDGGVVYIVDEAWKFYGAREWADTGKGVLFYGAQHRKLGDTVYIVTQNTKQIDTAIRQVAQDFWLCTNHGKLKFGPFRQPGMFAVNVYDLPPTQGLGVEPMERRYFKLDTAGLGACYDTASGVGVRGGGSADIGEKARGLHWGWAIAVIVALCIGAAMIPRLLGMAVSKAVVTAPPSGPATNAPGARVVADTTKRPATIQSSGTTAPATNSAPVIYCTGYYKRGDFLMFTFSDGSERSDGITAKTWRGVQVDGQWIPWATVPVMQERGQGSGSAPGSSSTVSTFGPTLSERVEAAQAGQASVSDRPGRVRVTWADGTKWQNY